LRALALEIAGILELELSAHDGIPRQRIADATGGKAAIVPIATIPGAGPRYTMMDDFAQAVRDVSDRLGLPYANMPERLKAEGREGYTRYLGDMAHPTAEGHAIMAQYLSDWLVAKAKGK
jgi:lysophospholipase L1-like esterase